MNVQVEGAQTYKGVRVDDPHIIESIQNLGRRGYALEHICRIIGMPGSVVRKHLEAIKK